MKLIELVEQDIQNKIVNFEKFKKYFLDKKIKINFKYYLHGIYPEYQFTTDLEVSIKNIQLKKHDEYYLEILVGTPTGNIWVDKPDKSIQYSVDNFVKHYGTLNFRGLNYKLGLKIKSYIKYFNLEKMDLIVKGGFKYT